MAWAIELSPGARRDLKQLDAQHARRILDFLRERLTHLEDPRSIGRPLHGQQFGGLWRYRVGNYRVICSIEDERFVVLVIEIGHRREIYRG